MCLVASLRSAAIGALRIGVNGTKQDSQEAIMEAEKQGEAMPRQGVWKRGLFMLLLAIAFGIGQVVLNTVAVLQFLWLLFTGEPNRFLQGFGRSLAAWLGDTGRFMTCASDEKPFPWQPWPAG
jgi:hypothetical protein